MVLPYMWNVNVLIIALRAPDGSCILTCSDDNTLKIFNLPASLYSDINHCCDEEMVIQVMTL